MGLDPELLTQPRRAGDRATLRVLLASRSLIDTQCTANRNALNALLRTAEIGVDAREPVNDNQIRTIAIWRIRRNSQSSSGRETIRCEARRLAITIEAQTKLLMDNHRDLRELAEKLAPALQDVPGVGPVTAAIMICAYSHHGRVRSEAAFAALGGIAPIPATSGNTNRHRLSRSDDRQLNRAFDVVVRTRMSCDPTTRAYVARRTAEGKPNREIRRCLKRYACRAIFRQMQTSVT